MLSSQQDVPESQEYSKIDILFYNSVLRAKKWYKTKAILHFLKSLILIVFLPIDVITLSTRENLIVIFMTVAIGVSLISIVVNTLILIGVLGNNYENNLQLFKFASTIDHTIPQQPIYNYKLDDIDDCVSQTMYNHPNLTPINSQGLTEQLKNIEQSLRSTLISRFALKRRCAFEAAYYISKILTLGVFIFGIVALAKSTPSTAELTVCIIYLLCEAASIWMILIVIIGIALSPLICFVACSVACCCGNIRINQRGLNMPESVKATQEIIKQGGGSCTICLQSFVVEEQVIVLSCSKKHVFHEGCISNWTSMKPSCPICRQAI